MWGIRKRNLFKFRHLAAVAPTAHQVALTNHMQTHTNKMSAPGAGYISSHWHGMQSLSRSFWVNNVLLSLPLGFALGGLMSWIGLNGESLQRSAIAVLLGWPLLLLINTWCIVGAWRASRDYLQIGGSALWTLLARLSLAAGALQTLLALMFGLLPQLGDYWQMARGIDPIGHATIKAAADGRSIELRGAIGMGDADRLQRQLAGSPQVRTLDLASPGGRLHEAERIAGMLRGAGFATRAVGDCESACTLIFLAGTQRQLLPGAQLGFHRASTGSFNPIFDEAANLHLASSYRQAGLPESFIERTVRTPADRMWYPRSGELLAHALIAAPPQTLEIALPPPDAVPADYADALRASPAWHGLEQRYPGTITALAGAMHVARAAQAGADDDTAAQLEAVRAVARVMPELIASGPPELRRRYAGLLLAQLRASGSKDCQALLGGDLTARRRLPVELLAREAAWLIEAAEAPPARWLPKPPSAVELEVLRRTLGAQASGQLSGVWGGGPGTSTPHAQRCEAAIQTLQRAAALPAAQRELVQRLMFQGPLPRG